MARDLSEVGAARGTGVHGAGVRQLPPEISPMRGDGAVTGRALIVERALVLRAVRVERQTPSLPEVRNGIARQTCGAELQAEGRSSHAVAFDRQDPAQSAACLATGVQPSSVGHQGRVERVPIVAPRVRAKGAK